MSCRHDWIETSGIAHGVRLTHLCMKCGTTFPCRSQPCQHVDCRLACGNTEAPPGVEYAAELDCSANEGVCNA